MWWLVLLAFLSGGGDGGKSIERTEQSDGKTWKAVISTLGGTGQTAVAFGRFAGDIYVTLYECWSRRELAVERVAILRQLSEAAWTDLANNEPPGGDIDWPDCPEQARTAIFDG